MEHSDFRPVKESKTTITELMIPSYANFGGKVHGGILLSLMDKVAYACASKHAGTYCVTASIDSVDFLAPVEVGELVSMKASVNYVGNTSLIVGIKVTSENVKTRVVKHTNTSYFTMVAFDDDNKPFRVPGLILETRDEVRRFVESMKRKELGKQNRQTVNSIKMPMKLESYNELIKNERCVVKSD